MVRGGKDFKVDIKYGCLSWSLGRLLPTYCSELKTQKSFQVYLSLTLMQVMLVNFIFYFCCKLALVIPKVWERDLCHDILFGSDRSSRWSLCPSVHLSVCHKLLRSTHSSYFWLISSRLQDFRMTSHKLLILTLLGLRSLNNALSLLNFNIMVPEYVLVERAGGHKRRR